MLKTIEGFRETTEAAEVMAAIRHRLSGARLFAHQPQVKPVTSQTPAL